jgi:hypothetical protein
MMLSNLYFEDFRAVVMFALQTSNFKGNCVAIKNTRTQSALLPGPEGLLEGSLY